MPDSSNAKTNEAQIKELLAERERLLDHQMEHYPDSLSDFSNGENMTAEEKWEQLCQERESRRLSKKANQLLHQAYALGYTELPERPQAPPSES